MYLYKLLGSYRAASNMPREAVYNSPRWSEPRPFSMIAGWLSTMASYKLMHLKLDAWEPLSCRGARAEFDTWNFDLSMDPFVHPNEPLSHLLLHPPHLYHYPHIVPEIKPHRYLLAEGSGTGTNCTENPKRLGGGEHSQIATGSPQCWSPSYPFPGAQTVRMHLPHLQDTLTA